MQIRVILKHSRRLTGGFFRKIPDISKYIHLSGEYVYRLQILPVSMHPLFEHVFVRNDLDAKRIWNKDYTHVKLLSALSVNYCKKRYLPSVLPQLFTWKIVVVQIVHL